MNNFLLIIFMAVAALSCSASAERNNSCSDFINSLPSSSSVAVDLEKIVPGTLDSLGTQELWGSITPIAIRCGEPRELPEQKRYDSAEFEVEFKPKALRAIKFAQGGGGILFIYPASHQAEELEGLAIALVIYDKSGQPLDAIKLASVMRFEGYGRIESSVVRKGSIEYCEEELEFFTYDEAGNITGRLDVPRREAKICRNLPRVISFPPTG